MTGKLLTSVIVLGLLAGCQQGPTEKQMGEQNREPLAKNDVIEKMTDITGYATNKDGTNIIIYRDSDGTVRGKASWTGGSEKDTGQWRVRDDGAMCTEWNKWLNGQEACYRIYDVGDSLIFTNIKGPGENYKVPKADIKDGNVESL